MEYVGSTIPNEIMKRMSQKDFGWNDSLSYDTLKALFTFMAIYLAEKKNKDQVEAVIINDINDKFHFGAYAQFINQDETGADEGSWAISYSFDESDFDEKNWDIHTFTEPDVQVTFEDTLYTQSGVSFNFKPKDVRGQICEGSHQAVLCMLIDIIRDYMIANVAINPDLDFSDIISFRAEASGDTVYIGCTPGAILKQTIKSDASIGTVGEDLKAAAHWNRSPIGTGIARAELSTPHTYLGKENCPTADIDLYQNSTGRIIRLINI